MELRFVIKRRDKKVDEKIDGAGIGAVLVFVGNILLGLIKNLRYNLT